MKTIKIPKLMYDLINNHKGFTEKERAGQIINLCVIEDNKEQILKTGKIELSFTLEEYAKRTEELINDNCKVEVVDVGNVNDFFSYI
ncbi:hypothetical protein ES705_17474 [subsurface metagenome]|jgi:hypothetical protein